MAKRYKVATIAGDGIGLEVLPEGIKVVKAAAEKHGIELQLDAFDWASCDYYLEHGKMMPDDWFETLQGYDAIYFGAVGWPDKVPDHISLWGSLLQFRRGFDQYVNLRPVRLMPGVKCPLVGKKPGDIDFYVVRENSEGEYSAIGGKAFEGTDREFVLQEAVFTRHGVDRILRYAFEFANQRDAKKLLQRLNQMVLLSACRTGMSALMRWQNNIHKFKLINSMLIFWRLVLCCNLSVLMWLWHRIYLATFFPI